MERPTILIAEDDTVLREIYLKKFTVAGYQVRTATNGQEAVDAAASAAPDLLLLDISMPVMDGYAVLKLLPRNQRKFPIIILTNFGDTTARKTCSELGADDFFVKSDMTIKSLLTMVENLLKAKKMWQS